MARCTSCVIASPTPRAGFRHAGQLAVGVAHGPAARCARRRRCRPGGAPSASRARPRSTSRSFRSSRSGAPRAPGWPPRSCRWCRRCSTGRASPRPRGRFCSTPAQPTQARRSSGNRTSDCRTSDAERVTRWRFARAASARCRRRARWRRGRRSPASPYRSSQAVEEAVIQSAPEARPFGGRDTVGAHRADDGVAHGRGVAAGTGTSSPAAGIGKALGGLRRIVKAGWRLAKPGAGGEQSTANLPPAGGGQPRRQTMEHGESNFAGQRRAEPARTSGVVRPSPDRGCQGLAAPSSRRSPPSAAAGRPSIVRAQGAGARRLRDRPHRPWTTGAQVSQEPNYLLWAEQQNAAGGLNVKGTKRDRADRQRRPEQHRDLRAHLREADGQRQGRPGAAAWGSNANFAVAPLANQAWAIRSRADR